MERERKLRRGVGVVASGRAALDLAQVEDGRDERGRMWRNVALWTAMLLGMLTGRKSLAETERLTEELPRSLRRKVGIARRAPDTTMRDLVMSTPLAGLRATLHRQIRSAHRRKALAPVGLPCGMAVFDGKVTMTDLPDEVFAQEQGQGRYAVRSMTCALVSARASVCIDAVPIPREQNDMSGFPAAFQAVLQAYEGLDLFELVSVDAGMTSKANADLIDRAQLGYLMALKSPQGELFSEALRLLGHLEAGVAIAQTSERVNGRTVTRRLWMTSEMAGYNDWGHLRTVVRVESEIRTDAGEVESRESRYFLSNERLHRFTPAQWLLVVRAHWRVEEVHKILDVEFAEDDRPWIRATHGLLAVQVLRRIAYNLLVMFRNISLRSEEKGEIRWRALFEWLDLAVRAATDRHLDGLRWEPRHPVPRA